MKNIKIIMLITSLFLLSGCKKTVSFELPEEISFNIQDVAEVHTNLNLNDILIETNADIINKDLKIDTTKIGEKKYRIHYKYKKRKHIYEFKINIIDNKAPVIIGSTNLTLLKDNTEDFCQEISYGDNYDSNPNCEIIGNYAPGIVGTYNPTMKITDSSGNETSKTLKIEIVSDKKNINGNNNYKSLEFQEVINNYKNENTEIGIDISSWQENVDFVKVKEAGATFVILRIGFQKGNGELKLDSYYLDNIQKVKEAGLKVGVYLYTDAGSIKEAEDHAKWLLKNLNGIHLDLPVVFDWENWANFNKYKMSFYDLNQIASTFLDTIIKSGYQGMLYGSKYYLENFWTNINNYPVWLAHYTENTSYKGNYLIWQLSNIGKIEGIEGNVDINVMYNK